eukprot:7917073-Alexandrium_andersonii.AAC.1
MDTDNSAHPPVPRTCPFRRVVLSEHPEAINIIRDLPEDFKARHARRLGCPVDDVTFSLAIAVPVTRLGAWYAYWLGHDIETNWQDLPDEPVLIA